MAVGAVANLMIQPYGALIAGCLAGVISTIGYRKIQVCNLHSTLNTKVFNFIEKAKISAIKKIVCGLVKKSYEI